MRPISRRVYRLEKQSAPRLDDQGRSIAEVIRERRRHRLTAERKEPEAEKPRKREDSLDSNGRPLSIAEIIRNRRHRLQLRAQAKAPGHKHD
jgi:hypothetical protein